jgi:hypothetical protein
MASERIILKEVILSFPQQLWVPGKPPTATADAPLKYSCQFVMDADGEMKKLVEAAIKRVAKAAWEKDWDKILNSIEGNANRMCFIDGNKRIGWKGYENRWGISAGRREADGPPALVDRRKMPVTQAQGLLYGGAVVNAIIDIFSYEKPGRGISAGLSTVQFVKHGESFGGASAATTDGLDDLGFGDEEEDMDDLA